METGPVSATVIATMRPVAIFFDAGRKSPSIAGNLSLAVF
jgi:hypothetical protein